MTKQKKVKTNKKARIQSRALHRSISLHPASLFVLLCVGVFLIASTFNSLAATSTSLTMKINALPLKEPAVISQPADQTRFVKPDISVVGSCPNESYVKLYKDDFLAGVALCESNTFSVMTTLRSGANKLQARVFNLTDAEGPQLGFITVYYDKPISGDPTKPIPRSPAAVGPSSPSRAEPLRIIADYTYKVYKSGQPVTLDLALSGGLPPYAVAIEWDEDVTTPIVRTDRNLFQVEHTYEVMPRLYTHIIKVAASDPEGNADFVQLMAVVGGKAQADNQDSSETPAGSGSTTGRSDGWLVYVWPAYLMIVLMVLSFYLGEREERRLILRKRQKPLMH